MIGGWLWQPYEALARQMSLRYGVAPELILAVMGVESAFSPNAYRAEPQINDGSRGLMQILLGTARALGFQGPPSQLFEAPVNADLGTKYLARQLTRYNGSMADAVSAYNGGHALRVAGGYANQAYVDRVLSAWVEFAAALAPKGEGSSDPPGGSPAPAGAASQLGVGLTLGVVAFVLWRAL